ncbi:MAG: protoporphyrinogen oxidase [Halanaeroarchaeum sp.]
MTVGVIGAGMSGLAVTHHLVERDVPVRTFEAAAEPGGVVRSFEVDGRVLEAGPQRLRRSKPVDDLITQLGLEDAVIEGDEEQPLYAYYDGALREMPLSVRAAIRTDLLSWRGKLRVLLEPLTAGPTPGETVEEFLTRAFGQEAATRFAGPLYSGLYGTDPDDMYVEHSLGRALETFGIDGSILLAVARRLLADGERPPIVSFERGVQTLPNAIYETHETRIALDSPVTAVEPDGDGYRIVTAGSETVVDGVVFTTPAPTTATLLASIDAEAAATVGEFNYNPIGVVHLESDFDGVGHGFHVVDEGFETTGCTWNASMLGRDGVFTAYVGSGNPSFLAADHGVIGRRAADEFETVTGAEASVLNVDVVRPGMPAYDRSWRALSDLSLPPDVEIASAFTERAGVVGRLADGRRTAARLAAD